MAKLERVTRDDIAEYSRATAQMGFNEYDGWGDGKFEFNGGDCWGVKVDGKTWVEWVSAALDAMVNDDPDALLKAVRGMDDTYWKMRCSEEREERDEEEDDAERK